MERDRRRIGAAGALAPLGRDGRQILVAIDGLLAAEFAAAENEQRRYGDDDGADDDSEHVVVASHGRPTSDVVRSSGMPVMHAESGDNPAEIGPFEGRINPTRLKVLTYLFGLRRRPVNPAPCPVF